ncbi:hypothetical protein ACFW81_33570 [Streptomyces angustmyceticus]
MFAFALRSPMSVRVFGYGKTYAFPAPGVLSGAAVFGSSAAYPLK